MLSRRVSAAAWMVGVSCLVAQDGYNREAYAQEHVKFLVLKLDQWTKAFPHDYNMALMRPPVDAGKLSDEAKAGATALGESITRLYELRNAKDLLTSAEFREQLDKALSTAKVVNETMGAQRFPMALQSDWEQIRTDLNGLARVYKVETLAALEPPGGGGGRGRGGRPAAAGPPAPAPGGGVSGYIVDQQCAARGKGMWTNAACVARCIREGDKVVLVTEEGKVYQIANPDKVEPDSYGQKVTITGKTNGDTITVENLQM